MDDVGVDLNVDDVGVSMNVSEMLSTTLSVLETVSVPLGLLNEGALFSQTVEELRESLLDGLLKRPYTFVSVKKALVFEQRARAAEKRVQLAAQKANDLSHTHPQTVITLCIEAVGNAAAAARRAEAASDALKTARLMGFSDSDSAEILLEKIEQAALDAEKIALEVEKEVGIIDEHTLSDIEMPDSDSHKALTKQQIIDSINAFERYVAEILEKNHWNEHFLEELGQPQASGEPFVEHAHDSFQVLQIKKIVNALYHFQLGLEAIESDDLKVILRYLGSDDPIATFQQQWREQAQNRTWRDFAYTVGSSLYPPNLAKAAVNPLYQANQIIQHIYRGCNLITHIEPEFLEAFGGEWSWMKEKLNSKGLVESFQFIQKLMAEQNGADNLKKVAYLQGVLLDQLRPNKTGGADYSLLIQLTTTGYEKTENLQVFLSDSDQLFSSIKNFFSSVGVESETLDKAKQLIADELQSRPNVEAAFLEDFQQTAAKLQKAFAQLSGKGEFSPFDVVHYASIVWHAWSLLSEMGENVSALSDASQQFIQEKIVELRNVYFAALVGFLDKIEETTLSAPGSRMKPLMAQLEVYYQNIISKVGFVDLHTLGPLQSEQFTEKRLEIAKTRRTHYKNQLSRVDEVLIPAIHCLMNPNPTELEKRKMASLFELLQPHFEAVDAGLSNQLLQDWKNRQELHATHAGTESLYPVISQMKHPEFIQSVFARLLHLSQTKELAIQLTEDTIASILENASEYLKTTEHQKTRAENVREANIQREKATAERVAEESHLPSPQSVDVLNKLPVRTITDLKPASDRKVAEYLIEDISEGVNEEGAADPTKDSLIRKLEKGLKTAQTHLEAYGIDPNGNHESPLSLTHITSTLASLQASCKILEEIRPNSSSLPYKSEGMYVVQTIQLFYGWISAILEIYPYGITIQSECQKGTEALVETYQASAKHYQMPKSMALPDLAYSGMHAALTGPAHLKALAKGYSDLPEAGKRQANEKADVFAGEIDRLNQHANLEWSLYRYPALTYDAGRILTKRLMGQETIDQQAIRSTNKLAKSVYKTAMEHGLDGLNHQVFHEMLCKADDAEQALTLPPGTLSLPLEHLVDDYRQALLDPLSVPSGKYFEVRVDEESFNKRAARMPDGGSHAMFLKGRLHRGSVYDVKLMERDDLAVSADTASINVELQRHLDSGALQLEQSQPTLLKLKSSAEETDKLRYVVYGNSNQKGWRFTELELLERTDLTVSSDEKLMEAELQKHLVSKRLVLGKIKPTLLKVKLAPKGSAKGSDKFGYFAYSHSKGSDWTFKALDASVFESDAAAPSKTLKYAHASELCEYITSHSGHTEKTLIEVRQACVREDVIDRALDLELMRIQKSKSFELKYANQLYLGALRKALRPAIHQWVPNKDIGGFEDSVFDFMYKKSIEDLSLFDESQDQGSCRLDAMCAYISNLENYLKQTYIEKHCFLFYLFEDQETHAKKLAWTKQLRALVNDSTRTPSERIYALQDLIQSKAFQNDMQAYSIWFSFAGIGRCVVWFLSCIQLCSYQTAGTFAFDSLVRAADLTVSELQVFDELYATDYRRLDAILRQITLLEEHLDPKKDASYVGRAKLYEDLLTRSKKRGWLLQLRRIAENTDHTPVERIAAMRELMSQKQFKSDMLTYAAIGDVFTFRAFKRAVLWLLSCVGLYTLPCVGECNALMHSSKPETGYSKSPLINVGLFSESAPSTDRNYTAESALDKLGLASAA
ncbi:MAG: hypothetical protein P1U61_00785 [Legionellaceae bacterium]|nr:hypothetical protein [Legionellaceae bacterium]